MAVSLHRGSLAAYESRRPVFPRECNQTLAQFGASYSHSSSLCRNQLREGPGATVPGARTSKKTIGQQTVDRMAFRGECAKLRQPALEASLDQVTSGHILARLQLTRRRDLRDQSLDQLTSHSPLQGRRGRLERGRALLRMTTLTRWSASVAACQRTGRSLTPPNETVHRQQQHVVRTNASPRWFSSALVHRLALDDFISESRDSLQPRTHPPGRRTQA